MAEETGSPSDLSALQRPLEQFRGASRRIKIHPRELAVLWIVGAHLALLPWGLGGMRLWAQIPSLGFALAGFIVALLPRDYREEHTGSTAFRLLPYPRLLRFPLFWLGLALLIYVAIQALNPAWVYETDGKGWWMRKVDAIAWLPSGVRVPFSEWGPWRMLLIYTSVWLTVCTLWVGVTRRRTLQLLLLALAANGIALSGFGLAQRVLSNGLMYWFWKSPNESFFASFIYKNHAGAYLDLTLGIACGLAAWYYLRGLRRMEKSNPSGLLVFFATGIAVAVLVSYARGATLVMLAFLCVCIGIFIVHQLVSPSPHRKPIVAIALILIFGYFLKTGLEALNSHIAWDRLKQGVTEQDDSIAIRRFATKAATEMLGDYWLRGAGAGGFGFLFPTYQQRYPELHPGKEIWDHAHNDLVEIPLELGLGGACLLLAAIGYLGLHLVRNYFWANPLSGCLTFMLVLVTGYAAWDFPFQCPAILLLWWTLATAATMWARFEETGAKA